MPINHKIIDVVNDSTFRLRNIRDPRTKTDRPQDRNGPGQKNEKSRTRRSGPDRIRNGKVYENISVPNIFRKAAVNGSLRNIVRIHVVKWNAPKSIWRGILSCGKARDQFSSRNGPKLKTLGFEDFKIKMQMPSYEKNIVWYY